MWLGLLAPKGTPPAIVERLHREVIAALATPEVKAYMATAGIEIVGSTPAEFGAYFRAEKDLWAKVVRDTGRKDRMTMDDAKRLSWAASTGRTRVTCACSCGRSSSDTPEGKPAVLFVHGSSMASQPTFDLTVPGRPDSSVMDWFARRGFVCWCVDMEGYGRSDKQRDIDCDIANGADDLAAATAYIAGAGGATRFLTYGISSGALRAALFAERHPERIARLALDAFVWTGEGAPTLEQRRKKLPEFLAQKRRPIDRAFVYSIFERDHPDCAERRVVDAFADAILALDDSMPNGTYIDMCSKLPVVDPARIAVPTMVMRGEYDGIAALPDLIAFFTRLPNAGQAVHDDGRHLARELPAEELPDGVPDPARVVHAAGAGLPLTAVLDRPAPSCVAASGAARTNRGRTLANPHVRAYDRRVPGGNPRRRQIKNRTGEDLTSWRRRAQAATVCIESST